MKKYFFLKLFSKKKKKKKNIFLFLKIQKIKKIFLKNELVSFKKGE